MRTTLFDSEREILVRESNRVVPTCLLAPCLRALASSCNELFYELMNDPGYFIAGGGLSAAQAALFAVKRGAAAVTLCSRRPLQTRHFDLPLEWFDPRHVNKQRFPFYGVCRQPCDVSIISLVTVSS